MMHVPWYSNLFILKENQNEMEYICKMYLVGWDTVISALFLLNSKTKFGRLCCWGDHWKSNVYWSEKYNNNLKVGPLIYIQ